MKRRGPASKERSDDKPIALQFPIRDHKELARLDFAQSQELAVVSCEDAGWIRDRLENVCSPASQFAVLLGDV